MTLALEAAIDRPLVVSSTPQERHLMLTLHALGEVKSRSPLNVALVIDASGSMDGVKIARAREAASSVVRHLSAVDRVAVVAYNDEVSVVAPSTPVTPQTKTDLLYRIGRVEADGNTNLGGGWLRGCQEVAQHQDGGAGLHRVLLLTDGLANVGITSADELVEHAQQLHQRGIATSTMGVGADFNEELLEGMARQGGGRFQYVETAKHIPDCVQGELGEMLSVSARGVAVEVSLPPGTRCVESLNDYPLQPTRSGVRLRLGDLTAGDERRVVLKLEVTPGDDRLTLGALALYFDTTTGEGTEVAFPSVQLDCAEPTVVEVQAENEAIAREVALLLAARAKQDAVRLSVLGDYAGAASKLAHASVALSASGFAVDPAMEREIHYLASMSSRARNGLGAFLRKELRYQSYLTREARRRYDPPRC